MWCCVTGFPVTPDNEILQSLNPKGQAREFRPCVNLHQENNVNFCWAMWDWCLFLAHPTYWHKCLTWTIVHLMLILSLQGLPQNQNLETVPIGIVVLCFPHCKILWVMCDTFVTSFGPFVTARTIFSRFIKYQYEPRKTFEINLWANFKQFSNRSHLFFFELVSMHGVATLYNCCVVFFFWSARNIYILLCMTFHDIGPWWNSRIGFPGNKQFSTVPAEILDSNIFL